MKLEIPEMSLVVLIGVSGAGKSTFARRHFLPTQVISSDACRAMITDNESALDANAEAFALLRTIAGYRLRRGLVTVIDATSVQPESRRSLVALAREHHCLPVAIVFDLPLKTCQDRTAARPDRDFGPHVVRMQHSQMKRGLRGLRREGFRHAWTLRDEAAVDAASVEFVPLWNNRKSLTGPFDIVGDVHGCFDELVQLLTTLGYVRADGAAWRHPDGRTLVFVGDLIDRGPHSPEVVQLAMESVQAGSALAVPGNHDMKFVRKIRGKNVSLTHGLAETLEQFAAREATDPGATARAADFFDGLVSHLVLDGGRLVVAHAGLKEEMHGRGSGAVREFCLYGETTGESDEFGLPERLDWAADYRGSATVVYGHTPFREPRRLNGTINIDTGCAFGGALTAFRYPEQSVVSVPALREYAAPARPLRETDESGRSAQMRHDALPDLADVTGRRRIDTALVPAIAIREENAIAALEVMSRFAVDPRWLIHLPPTMSPSETSARDPFLEHPAEALDWYAKQDVPEVICEEKHMGSRAIVVVARNAEAAAARFGVDSGERGSIFTRTGRPFFRDAATSDFILTALWDALAAIGLPSELDTDWICLDCEILPWSAKAQSLLRDQYAPAGAAAEAFAAAAATDLAAATARLPADPQLASFRAVNDWRVTTAGRYRDAYRRYCRNVTGPADYRIAPFHFLACESETLTGRHHPWHMETAARLAAACPATILPTRHLTVCPADESQAADAVAFWESILADGGEGMVVKPLAFAARADGRLLQPALKCRGPEYLRIIYGPDYDSPQNLPRLRQRGLRSKRTLALREFALGLESLHRFVAREPLRRVHECVFAVLALESEPVDPRL